MSSVLQHIQHYTSKPFEGGFDYIEILKTLGRNNLRNEKSCPMDGGNYNIWSTKIQIVQ